MCLLHHFFMLSMSRKDTTSSTCGLQNRERGWKEGIIWYVWTCIIQHAMVYDAQARILILIHSGSGPCPGLLNCVATFQQWAMLKNKGGNHL